MANADTIPSQTDTDPLETAEWLDSLRRVLENQGPERVAFLLQELSEAAHRDGVELPFTATTPYINTIPESHQPPYPGNREIERHHEVRERRVADHAGCVGQASDPRTAAVDAGDQRRRIGM